MKVTFGAALVSAAIFAVTCEAVELTSNEAGVLDREDITKTVPEVLVASTSLILGLTDKLNQKMAELEDAKAASAAKREVIEVDEDAGVVNVDFDALMNEA